MNSPPPTETPRGRLRNRPWLIAAAGFVLAAIMAAAFTTLLQGVRDGTDWRATTYRFSPLWPPRAATVW
jgi:hypothetical protein